MKRCGADVLHVLGLKSQKQTKMRIAITGGIGSGKSYVCREIERHGFTVYDCDSAAKRLMRSDADLQQALCQLVGDEVCRDGVLQSFSWQVRTISRLLTLWCILLWHAIL